MALPNRYPLPQIWRKESHRTEDGRILVVPIKAINWSIIIGAMKLRALEQQAWKDDFIVSLE